MLILDIVMIGVVPLFFMGFGIQQERMTRKYAKKSEEKVLLPYVHFIMWTAVGLFFQISYLIIRFT